MANNKVPLIGVCILFAAIVSAGLELEEADEDGLAAGDELMNAEPKSTVTSTKRTRKEISEIDEKQLAGIVQKEPFVAVLYHDTSKFSQKTLRDLELIRSDSDPFEISWFRSENMPPDEVQEDVLITDPDTGEIRTEKKLHPATVVLYKDGVPIRYPGRPDRQTAVLRWMVTETFCHKDRPLEVELEHIEILVRSFRSFVMICSSLGNRKSRRLVRAFSAQHGICHSVDSTLIVNTRDERVFDAFYIDVNAIPVVLHIVHGIAIEYPDSVNNVLNILTWISKASESHVQKVSEINLETIIKREDLVAVLFMDEAGQNRALAAQVRVSLADLETLFGMAVVTVSEMSVAKNFGIDQFPEVALFQGGTPKWYEGSLDGEDAAIDVKNWISNHVELKEKTVIKSIESADFKSQPNEFKNVLLKEHKDAIQKLSKEYTRLLRQNQKLKEIIKAAKEALDSPLVAKTTEDSDEPPPVGMEDEEPDSDLSAECGECLAAVGQAVWNCGTLEMECIKNTLELGSECYGCVCEIFDVWWPDDAPNCFKKELKKIVGKATDVSGNATIHMLPNTMAGGAATPASKGGNSQGDDATDNEGETEEVKTEL